MGEATAWSDDDAEVTGGEPFDPRGDADHDEPARHHRSGRPSQDRDDQSPDDQSPDDQAPDDQDDQGLGSAGETGKPEASKPEDDRSESETRAAEPNQGGTSRDESGVAASSQPSPRPRRPLTALLGTWPPQQWPLAIVIGGIGLSLLVVAVDDFRPGTVLFSGCLLLSALFRLVLPESQAGLLVLRSRAIDVLLMLLLGVCILLLAILIPDLPEGGLPAVQQ